MGGIGNQSVRFLIESKLEFLNKKIQFLFEYEGCLDGWSTMGTMEVASTLLLQCCYASSMVGAVPTTWAPV